MAGYRTWDFRYGEDEAQIHPLPYRPEESQANDPLLGIDTFAPAFWRLVADPAKPVPFAAAPSGGEPNPPAAAPIEEISIVANRPQRRVTDDQIANVVFNETVSLTGPGVDEMRRQMAQTIMNADEAFGQNRTKWAKTQRTDIDRDISPLEASRLEQIRKRVTEARERFDRGEDPTNLATNYIMRDDNGGPPSKDPPAWATDKTALRLESIQGPYPDSQANKEPAKYVYIWQNKLADKYYGRGAK